MSKSRLTFLKHSHNKIYIDKNGYKNTTVYNIYKCECGNLKTASRSHVKTLQVKSCGCLKKESDRKMGLTYKGNLIPMKKGDKPNSFAVKTEYFSNFSALTHIRAIPIAIDSDAIIIKNS